MRPAASDPSRCRMGNAVVEGDAADFTGRQWVRMTLSLPITAEIQPRRTEVGK